MRRFIYILSAGLILISLASSCSSYKGGSRSRGCNCPGGTF